MAVSNLRTLAEAYWINAQPEAYPLIEWVRDRRDDGVSWRAIANEVRDRTDGAIDLPPQTLLNWADSEQVAS